MESLLNLPAAFGLGISAGLNASLPLALVSLMSRMGYVHLASPFDALGSDVAFYGLILLALLELAIDKIPGLDSFGHALLFPLSVAAGAILFASQSGAVSSVHPGLTILIGMLAGGATAGAVHTVRSTIRPFTHSVPLLGTAVSAGEDITVFSLVGSAFFAPFLVPVILVIVAIATYLLVKLAIRVARSVLKRGKGIVARVLAWLGLLDDEGLHMDDEDGEENEGDSDFRRGSGDGEGNGKGKKGSGAWRKLSLEEYRRRLGTEDEEGLKDDLGLEEEEEGETRRARARGGVKSQKATQKATAGNGRNGPQRTAAGRPAATRRGSSANGSGSRLDREMELLKL